MGIGEELEKSDVGVFERLMYLICSQTHLLVIALAFEVMLLTLAVLAAVFGNLNEATETILLLDFLLLGVAILPTAGFMWYCRQN